MTLKEKLEKYRKLIFILELAGLLHDIGKLDSRFIDYRKKWQRNIDGFNYRNDPHDDLNKPFFDNDPLLKRFEFIDLYKLLSKNIKSILGKDFIDEDKICLGDSKINLNISFSDIIHWHEKAKDINYNKKGDNIAQFISLGDSIDSAYDRNNPLYCNEQLNFNAPIFKSTVFGYETVLENFDYEYLRESVYNALKTFLPTYFELFSSEIRKTLFDQVEMTFSKALSDTCRPANDITLWQHCYVTAALAKVFFVHFLIYKENLPYEIFLNKQVSQKEFFDAKFALCGFGWDGLSFISKGQKIGDIVARKRLIHELKEGIKEIIEFKYPIGMNIYDDDNGISFVIPMIVDKPKYEDYSNLLSDIQKDVIDLSNNITDGEILPVYVDNVKETHYIMEIVNVIEELKEKSVFPYDSNGGSPLWINNWDNKKEEEICNICGKRPVKRGKIVCEICEERRKLAQKFRGDNESIFSDEIADENGRLCLIVAKFNLLPWLSGDMLWTLFVKSPINLKCAYDYLGEIKDLEEIDKKRKEIIEKKYNKDVDFNYKLIKEQIDVCLDPKNDGERKLAEALGFLYDIHSFKLTPPTENLNNIKNKWLTAVNGFTIGGSTLKYRFGEEADIYNYLLTKNHTPSRLLSVWNTTRDFLKGLFNSSEIREIFTSFRRLKIEFDKSSSEILPINNACYEAEINGEKVELFRRGENIFLVNPGREELNLNDKREKWLNREVSINIDEFEKKENTNSSIKPKIVNLSYSDEIIYPFRVITASPDLLMVIIPADKTTEITKSIYCQYMKHFGKVVGRLPLSIGHIFFQKRMPMFVVLDSGKRMEENFSNRYKEYFDKDKRENMEDSTIKVEHINENEQNGKKKIIFNNGLEWNIDALLGNRKEDYFHPYFIVKEVEKLTERNTYFKTFLGDLVHLSEIKEDDIIRVCPSFYDFEFLDSTTRRYDIILNDKTKSKRKSNVTQSFTKPYLLDEFKFKFIKLWSRFKKSNENAIIPNITDTKLRNIESHWLSKLQEWKVNLKETSGSEYKEWLNLIETTLLKELGDDKIKNPKDFEWLKGLITSGLFFDCLELNLRILKNKVQEEKNV